MTLPRNLIIFSSFLLVLISPSLADTSFRPKALVLPVTKDTSSLLYFTQFNQRTPLVSVNTVLDLGGLYLWVDCGNYVSSTYKPARCNSAQCNLANANGCTTACFGTPRPGCNNNTCALLADNTVTNVGTDGELGQDVVSLQSTDGSNPGRVVSVSNLLFTCAPSFILNGLPSSTQGMSGLGRTRVSLPSQFAASFSFNRKFAICLSSSKGVIFFGNEPYIIQPNVDVSKILTYTPLILNPVSTAAAFVQGDPSSDYFIGVKSININGKSVPVNTTLLSINTKTGFGGTKFSTVNPYTVMETSIFNAVINAFVKELADVPRVASVAPFKACFDASKITSTRLGPGVPTIELVLPNNVIWRIFGANSMVEVNDDVLCLGFVDGGANPRTSIVIGGHQLENNLLQFDLASSRLGFSSLLFGRQTTCANFDFTSKA
ncbi:probable aspartic proteinase GIP2 [Mercurialis annua]|uniref:probable aspartic proteinase GIP2 n=1 Tax=Mercurialis annua TaxID=3986 RepID=UPI00215F51D6|nr:probable aspartic proteinase GIP2 [Mercurialis annua]